MIYLISPYSHESEVIRHARYEQASLACAILASRGYVVYSPIVHWHPVVVNNPKYALKTGHEFWKFHNYKMMDLAIEGAVLMIDDWEESKGVIDDLKYIRRYAPIRYLTIDDCLELPDVR